MKRAASLAMAATGPGSNRASRAEPDRNVRPGMNRTSGAITFGAALGDGHLDLDGAVAFVEADGAGAAGPGVQPDTPAANSATTANVTTAGGACRILALR
jgi:hypothetical protein